MKIAIDGPSGAGKSTIAKCIAKELGILYLDTGAMYRAIGYKVFSNHLDYTREQEIAALLPDTRIEIEYRDGAQHIILDGEDVSTLIRAHHMSAIASDVSSLKCVRLFLVQLQQAIAQKEDCVLDGRDIGTYVLPDADFKFYLTASLDERAKRRCLELRERGSEADFACIRRDIAQRDHNDMHRDFAPLRKAADAIEVDSTHMDIQEVARTMIAIIKQA